MIGWLIKLSVQSVIYKSVSFISSLGMYINLSAIVLSLNLLVIVFIVIREWGDIGLFIKLVPKVLKYCFLIRWLNNLGDFYWILMVGSFIWVSKPLQLLIVICTRCNFVYHLWGCASIYRPLFYPFRSLNSYGLIPSLPCQFMTVSDLCYKIIVISRIVL